jgi:hypothetical protein
MPGHGGGCTSTQRLARAGMCGPGVRVRRSVARCRTLSAAPSYSDSARDKGSIWTGPGHDVRFTARLTQAQAFELGVPARARRVSSH